MVFEFVDWKIAEWSGEGALQGGRILCFGMGCDHGFGVLERRTEMTML